MAVPAGMLSRWPNAASRSNTSAALVSKKMVVASYLDGSVPGIAYQHANRLSSRVRFDITRAQIQQIFPWLHNAPHSNKLSLTT